MNSTISRFAIAVPVAAAIFGWSLSAAQAAPYEPSDHIEVQPAENDWPHDIDAADPDEVDEPEDPPADDPADEPAEEPTDDEDAEEESDEESDEDTSDDDSNDSGQFVATSNSNDEDRGSTANAERADAVSDDEADAVETASGAGIAPSFRPAGVQVPLLMVVGAGALLAGIAGWAGYRRHQLFAH